MSKKLKLPLLFVLSFLFLALSSSPASADIFWSTPEQINTSSNHAALPATVTGPNGYLHTVWAELDPASPNFNTLNPGVFYSYWNGDAWSEPVEVSQNTDGFAGFPGIAVTSNNTVHIIWEDDSSNPANSWGRILYSSSTDYGNSWSTPVSVAESLDIIDGSWSWWADMVADSADNLHVTFIYWNDYEWTHAYYTKWNGSTWETPQKLTINPISEEINNAKIAVDNNNYPHVVLEQDDPSQAGRGIYYLYFNGSSWSTPEKIGLDSNSRFPRIIIDNANNRHVAWSLPWVDETSRQWKIRVEYIKGDGGGWTEPYAPSTQATFSSWLTPIVGLTLDSDDNIYIGWGEKVGWGDEPLKGIQVSYRKWSVSSGTWSGPIFMRYVYDLATPFIYRDKWDNQHFAWTEQVGPGQPFGLWYSTVPINVGWYNPSSEFSLTLNITGDTLTIPAGALATTATISAQIGPLPASADPQYTTLPRSYTYRPHGTTFISGLLANAKIYYTDAEVVGSDERNMVVYIWDSSINNWSASFDTSVNTVQNRLNVNLPHFSLFGIAAPKVKVNWLPPISKAETYELKEGSSLPVKFTLSHYDETPLGTPELPEDVVVVIKKDGVEVEGGRYEYGESGDDVRYNPATGQYIANIHTRELGLKPDNYTVEVLIFGQSEATEATSTKFEITEKGKVKGTSTP